MDISFIDKDQYIKALKEKRTTLNFQHEKAIFCNDHEKQLGTSLELQQIEHELKFGVITIEFIKKMITDYLSESEKLSLIKGLKVKETWTAKEIMERES